MKIVLLPQRRDPPYDLSLSISGPLSAPLLTLNQTQIALAQYDAELAPDPLIVGQPQWDGTQWQVALILPHGPDAPPHVLFPNLVQVLGPGSVTLPTAQGDMPIVTPAPDREAPPP